MPRSSPSSTESAKSCVRLREMCLRMARMRRLRRSPVEKINQGPMIPTEGFYEWREEHGKKQPYFFARKDGKPVMFAGIWDYSEVKGEAVPSFAILTDEPNELVAPYHDRMPVVLGDVERWLNLDTMLSDPSVSPCARLIRRSTRSRKRTSTRSSAPPDPLRCAAFLASTGEGYQNLHSP